MRDAGSEDKRKDVHDYVPTGGLARRAGEGGIVGKGGNRQLMKGCPSVDKIGKDIFDEVEFGMIFDRENLRGDRSCRGR